MTREDVVEISKTWIKTPYVAAGRVKGAGTDCGMFLMEVFEEAQLIPHTEVGFYVIDHHMHSSQENYLGWVRKYAVEVYRNPLPGDILLYKIGKCISHGAIVLDYPLCIHAHMGLGVVMFDASQSHWKKRQSAVYSVWRDE